MLLASKSFACFFDRFFERLLRKEGSEDPGESFEEAPRELRETFRDPLEAPGRLREVVRHARGAPESFGSGQEGPGRLWESVRRPPGILGGAPRECREPLGELREVPEWPWEASGSVLRTPRERIVRYVTTLSKLKENR